ncbi:xylulokinase [Ornithinibacillus gellani]|uniref:xylulokinase n=1 Tax=Ornithinibacillus gellani TaxID=2293253 RepID=UPI000F48DEAB|nr:xylulokinase [Ornithinibacillus gellani]TQS75136.1 xylulokinase [Ornithinibacillus gellani]
MKYVIGIDLGTSAVKVLLVNQLGVVVQEISNSYPIIQRRPGYSEQDPEVWVEQTIHALKELHQNFTEDTANIEGISFSGQMHGLVLLDENNEVLRPAILWNDTRTTEQCKEIYDVIGKERLLEITKNPALEGFTLPKLLWVKKYEPALFARIKTFVLPKDYLRFRLTNKLQMEYSDAAGTLLLDIAKKEWSTEICERLDINLTICPPLVTSDEMVGELSAEIAKETGLQTITKVFAGGADNACGAIGAGILQEGKTLCSIGTSGVVLSYESSSNKDFNGKVHYFNHSAPNTYYTMGVTLSAGHSLSWFKNVFAKEVSFDELLANVEDVPVGANGLLFSPYLVGERTPHADSTIRGSFIGIDASHKIADFTRAVLEGITFSLNESIHIFREEGKIIDTIVSIGGGAKSDTWLQMQADVFDAKIIKLTSEQGPGMGAAMIAAYGCNWFETLQACADVFLKVEKEFIPNEENIRKYKELFGVYREIYSTTKVLNEKLLSYRS